MSYLIVFAKKESIISHSIEVSEKEYNAYLELLGSLELDSYDTYSDNGIKVIRFYLA